MESFDINFFRAFLNQLDLSGEISASKLLYQSRCWSSGTSFFSMVIPFFFYYCLFQFYYWSVGMDPSSLVDDWSRLSLTSEEEEIAVVADREVVDRSNLSLDLCLLGKLLCHRPLGAEVVRRNFRAAWKLDNELQVDRLGRNLFIFRFVNEFDWIWIMRQGPWLFEKFLLLLVFPIRGLKPSDHPFSSIALWIHIFKLPLDWFNQTMAERLGNAIGIFEDVDNQNEFPFWDSSLRIRVRLDLNRPLRRGIRIYPDGPLSGLWVPIRYERLPKICSRCGIIGHLTRDCALFLRSDRGLNYQAQYGDWLRFSGRGMLISPTLVNDEVNADDREVPQSQRLAIEVLPVKIPAPTENEIPH